ncbi:hypothetical protein [Rhodanobacter lindaniclasticus]
MNDLRVGKFVLRIIEGKATQSALAEVQLGKEAFATPGDNSSSGEVPAGVCCSSAPVPLSNGWMADPP